MNRYVKSIRINLNLTTRDVPRDANIMPLPHPQFLDARGDFDISREFLVSERLDSLSYYMASAAPYWTHSSEPPTVSKSRSTNQLVMTESDCTAKRLLGPAEDCTQKILNLSLDFRPDSPLQQALTGPSDILRYFRHCIISTSMQPQINPFPDRCEDDYFKIVACSLQALVPLSALSILQLWINDGYKVNPDAFHNAIQTLIRLEVTEVARDLKCKPDHAAGGPKTEITKSAMSHGEIYAFAMIDRKSKAFVEYTYQDRGKLSFTHPGFLSLTKDTLIEDIISDGRAFRDIRKTFIGKKDELKYSGGWRVHTLHLLGQVCLYYFFFISSNQNFVR
jgi:hypothetical protein